MSGQVAAPGPNPSGLCQCGCDQRTNKARTTRRGDVVGQPLRYLPGHNRRKSPLEFVEVDRGYKVDGVASLCWIWQRTKNKAGYGLGVGDGGSRLAHRCYYEEMAADMGLPPLEEGLHLHHLCQQPDCVFPLHCLPVTPREHAMLTWEAKHNSVRAERRELAVVPTPGNEGAA